MSAAQLPWEDVVDGQVGRLFATVLAGVLVAAEDLSPAERDFKARAVNHVSQADHGGQGKDVVGSVYVTPSIEDQRGFLRQHEPNGALETADVDGFEIRVEDEHRLIHLFCKIIARGQSEASVAYRHNEYQK